MKKIITITNPMKVKTGDKAYFKGCDFGFTVRDTDNEDPDLPFTVTVPFSHVSHWVQSSRFDHATREVEEQEWPIPRDIKLHDYLGADGRRYIYNPVDGSDTAPWTSEGYAARHSRNTMESSYRDALPLTELKLVPVKDDGGNDTGITIVCNLTADPEKRTTRRNNA